MGYWLVCISIIFSLLYYSTVNTPALDELHGLSLNLISMVKSIYDFISLHSSPKIPKIELTKHIVEPLKPIITHSVNEINETLHLIPKPLAIIISVFSSLCLLSNFLWSFPSFYNNKLIKIAALNWEDIPLFNKFFKKFEKNPEDALSNTLSELTDNNKKVIGELKQLQQINTELTASNKTTNKQLKDFKTSHDVDNNLSLNEFLTSNINLNIHKKMEALVFTWNQFIVSLNLVIAKQLEKEQYYSALMNNFLAKCHAKHLKNTLDNIDKKPQKVTSPQHNLLSLDQDMLNLSSLLVERTKKWQESQVEWFQILSTKEQKYKSSLAELKDQLQNTEKIKWIERKNEESGEHDNSSSSLKQISFEMKHLKEYPSPEMLKRNLNELNVSYVPINANESSLGSLECI